MHGPLAPPSGQIKPVNALIRYLNTWASADEKKKQANINLYQSLMKMRKPQLFTQ